VTNTAFASTRTRLTTIATGVSMGLSLGREPSS
jgi:hypothetical protein